MSRFDNLIILTFLFILPVNLLSANEKTFFIDVEYIIQNSNIGKKSLNKIKVLNDKNIGLLEKKNKSLNELEISIRNKKNIISVDEFNNEVIGFQKKSERFYFWKRSNCKSI